MSIYSPPTQNVAIFDTELFNASDNTITQGQADKRYLRFPVAQGNETLQAIEVNGVATFKNNIVFPDSTVQNSAFTGGTPGPYTNTNMTIDANGKISSIASGTTVPITDVNTDATFFPVFVSGTGNRALNIDSTTGPFTINPSTGTISFATTMRIDASGNKTAVGLSAGRVNQGNGTTALGNQAGENNQVKNATAIGNAAGNSNQGDSSVAIGVLSGQVGQAADSVAIGNTAASLNQGTQAIAIGRLAGQTTQSGGGIAIGNQAGYLNQGGNSIAIGVQAGEGTTSGLGTNSIAIGTLAGRVSQVANSICLNASGVAVNPAVAGLHINPVRNVTQTNVLGYDTASKEITYYTPSTSPFVPRAANYSDYQNVSGSGGYSQGTIVTCSGTWGAEDYIILRVTAQGNWKNTGSGWENFAITSGQLIFRPFYAPAGPWAAIAPGAGTQVKYTTNSGNSNIGSIGKALYYTGAINNGTQNSFIIGGTDKVIQFGFTSPSATGGWNYSHLIEYITRSPTGGTVTFTNGSGSGSTNNILP